MDLIRIIIESINENEVLEAYSILKGLDVPEKNMELKESGQELVLRNIANLLTKHVTTLSYEKMNDIVSKVEDDKRSIHFNFALRRKNIRHHQKLIQVIEYRFCLEIS